jgi:hypothetical protein
VIIPNVPETTSIEKINTISMWLTIPSAPIKSFVVSKPADDFLDLRRVLITSPDGKTIVWERFK